MNFKNKFEKIFLGVAIAGTLTAHEGCKNPNENKSALDILQESNNNAKKDIEKIEKDTVIFNNGN